MDQNGLKDLLLSMAAEISAEYEKNLIDRNAKFEEITLLNRKVEELKAKSEDTVFSPRSKLSAYDSKLSFEQQIARENLELAKLDSVLDTLLNRKEELLEGVELLDSILEEREDYYEKLQDITSKNNIPADTSDVELENSKEDVNEDTFIPSQNDASKEEAEEDGFTPGAKELMEALSYVAHQCGEISDFTIQDPYRARNELRSIANKWGN